MRFNSKTGEWADIGERFLCSFGLVEGLGAVIAAGAADVGVGAATAGVIGEVGAGALIGAGGGAALGAATGGDPGLGALTGAISGGAIGGLGPVVGETLGVGVIGGDALVGAGAGAVGAGITGGNPLTAAAIGGVSGAAAGALGGTTPSGADASGATAPGPSAASVAPPPGSGISGVSDLTVTPAPTGGGGLAIDGGLPSTPFASTVGGAGSGVGAVAPGGFDLGSTIATAGGAGGAGGTGLPAPGAGAGVGGGGPFSAQPTTQVNAAPSIPTPSTAASASAPNSIGTAIDNPTWHNIGHAVGANAAPIVAGGGLLYSLFNKPDIAGLDALKGQATAFQQQGSQLESYLQSGQLPPGAQRALDLATKSAEANVRSRYAAMGMSGSTAEAQDIDNVKFQAQAQAFSMADQLLKTGIDESGLAANIYENLANIDIQQNQQTGSAIASLAAALGGGVQLKIG